MPRVSYFPGVVTLIAALAVAGCSSTPETNPVTAAVSVRPASGSSATTGNAVRWPVQAPSSGNVVGLGPRVNRSRDAYVLLSGGGTPLSNNYSQFLQARAITEFFERECPPERTWVFFGVGNQAGSAPLLADARREHKRDGLLVQSWLPGQLARNRPATRESFLRALREEILPLVREGGTLYLFVGDHGELAGSGEQRESAITMWQLKQNRRRAGEWTTDDDEVLGVAELRRVLAEGLGAGRVVFGMTQCHSGGFHELGLAREMTPPSGWFTGAPPAWAVGNAAGVQLRVAGFTATDMASPAAGCDADPDPERWAGYERFLPESLLGLDLMSGQPKGRRTLSLADAHEAATLVDQTIDKPRSTSEHYLESWARMIETRLADAPKLTSAARNAVSAYVRAVDRGRVATADDGLRERQAQFERFTRRLAEQAPAAADVILRGDRQQLEAALKARNERPASARGPRRASTTELRKTWTDTLRPVWKASVLSGRVPSLTGPALEFEKRLLKLEDGGRDFLLARGGTSNALLNEIYWSSSYAEPKSYDRAKAEAVARWGAERRSTIISWAKKSHSPEVRAAGEKIGPGPVFVAEAARPLSRKTAVERALFYRRILAAWEFLVTMRAESALEELHTLIELERMPLRPET